ncbi:MAG: 4-hydroxybenzoate octaprenyltransferase [Hyphomicrobiales bacterium]|nr:4-hydroxybenzoate octaprenyltransferase [Hyphomicrobiales bacterium]
MSSGSGAPAPDALPDSVGHSLALRLAPDHWRPFVQLARIDRPIGWWLLLLPCWWSAALAASSLHTPLRFSHLVLFWIGAVAMRGAGSTYNDLVDREIDAGVERTRGRPLPSGRVSVRAAKIFLVAQCAVGALVLFSFNTFAIATGLASLLIVAVYPFMKRITSWPQAVLGLAFAWGGLMGWAAAAGSLAAPAFLIYLAAILWTMGYDTIYALQDARDDALVGIKSTARLFGDHVRTGVGLLYAGAVVTAGLAVWLAGAGIVARLAVLAFAAHLAWQVSAIRPQDTARSLMLFRSNRDAGLILFAGLALDALANGAALLGT